MNKDKKKLFKVEKILEPDYGCEERPEGQEKVCDVVLRSEEELYTVPIADALLYEKDIREGDVVYFEDENCLKKFEPGPMSDGPGMINPAYYGKQPEQTFMSPPLMGMMEYQKKMQEDS